MEEDQGQYESPSERGHHDHNNNINPLEDEGSLATGDTNRNNNQQGDDDGSRGLRIKIKKGNNNSESEEARNKNNNKQPLRVCHICNKGFNTGKALGGHMRMHALSSKEAHKPKKKRNHNNNNTWVFMDGTSNNPTCYLCRKSFFSMKALFGHMRSHPERVWRGIQPPLSTTTPNDSAAAISSNSASSSSTLSHDSAIDLSNALRGWSVTAKRGRKSLSCDTSLNLGVKGEQHRMLEGVYELLLLASGDPKTGVECKDTSKMKREFFGSVDDQVELSSVNSLKFEDKMGYEEEGDSDSQNSGGSIVGIDMDNRNNKKKKGTKKMKLNEIRTADEGNKLDSVAANRYRCSICNKSFPSYQALGGHSSNHRKSKNIIQSMDELESDDVSASEDQEEKQGHHAKTTTMHGDETKTLIEDALGCCSSTVENGQNCPKNLSFDLNQPPTMDEDEGIQLDLFLPANMVPSSYYASTSQNSATN